MLNPKDRRMEQIRDDCIDVLLATHLPDEVLLREQKESILAQTGVKTNLLMREDIHGDGPCANFSALLDTSESPYAAFCDQDDVWLQDKLARTLALMKSLEAEFGSDVPILVHTDATVVDANLNVLSKSNFRRQGLDPNKDSLNRLLLQNVVQGATVLANRALVELARPIPSDAVMHDHWLALVAAAFGKIACLREPTMLYRQHSENALGSPKVGLSRAARLAMRHEVVREKLTAYVRQASAFLARYEDKLAPKHRAMLEDFAALASKGFFARRTCLLRHKIVKCGFVRNLGLMLLI